MRRRVDYTWRLAELMAARGLHDTTDLIPLLAQRGIVLSRPQVYRLVNQRPERVALQAIAAICDIFQCGPEDLITVTAAEVRGRKTATAKEPPPNVVDLNCSVRPRRARIIDNDECAAIGAHTPIHCPRSTPHHRRRHLRPMLPIRGEGPRSVARTAHMRHLLPPGHPDLRHLSQLPAAPPAPRPAS